MRLASIDVSGLVELVWFAPLAALAVTISFSLCVVGATRSSDARRLGRGAESMVWFALAIVAGVAVAAEIVFGIGIIAGFWGDD